MSHALAAHRSHNTAVLPEVPFQRAEGVRVLKLVLWLRSLTWGWLENDHALHAEGVQAIREVSHCTIDVARAVLGDPRSRKRIDVTVTLGGDPLPIAKLRRIRPPNKG